MQTTELATPVTGNADATLAEIVRRIASVEPRARIILFGSRARGDARPDSDYDLVIIAPWLDPDRSPSGHIRRALRGIDAAMDLLVLTPEDWNRGLKLYGSVVQDVARQGLVLYGG